MSDNPRDIRSAAEHIDEQPPVDLPRVPRLFWSARPEFEQLAELPTGDVPDVLERLGPPPFPKTGFPFIGFLATIYDHVAGHAQGRDGK